MGQDLGKAHQRQLFHGKKAVQPFSLHSRAADTEDLHLRGARLASQRMDQPRPDHVARRLACQQEDLGVLAVLGH